MKNVIKLENVDGQKWFETVYRGVRYSLTYYNSDNEWVLYSHRLSMSRARTQIRHFDSLAQLSQSTKAFDGLSLALSANIEA